MTKALVVQFDGLVKLINLKGNEHLEQLNALVGGYIEGHFLKETAFCYLNEDGKELMLPPNRVGTELFTAYRIGFDNFDHIVGNLIVVGTINPDTKEQDGESYDVPVDVINTAKLFAVKFVDET